MAFPLRNYEPEIDPRLSKTSVQSELEQNLNPKEIPISGGLEDFAPEKQSPAKVISFTQPTELEPITLKDEVKEETDWAKGTDDFSDIDKKFAEKEKERLQNTSEFNPSDLNIKPIEATKEPFSEEIVDDESKAKMSEVLNALSKMIRNTDGKKRTALKLLDYKIEGKSVEEAKEVLENSEASISGEVEKLKSIIDPVTKVKVSRIVEFPKQEENSVEVDTKRPGGIDNILQEKYEPKENHSQIAEEIVSGNALDRDSRFADEAKKYYLQGDVGNALVYVDRIMDNNAQASAIRDLIGQCESTKDFASMRKFIGKVRDADYKETLSKWLEGRFSFVIPEQISNQTNKEELSFVKETPETIEEKAKSLEPETTPDPNDLPLNNKNQNASVFDSVLKFVNNEKPIDVGDVVLDKGEEPKATVQENIVESPEAKVEKVEQPKEVQGNILNPEEQKSKNEKIQADLDKARDEYARYYVDWEYKTRHSIDRFKKTLFALGAVKPVPERLLNLGPSLENALEEYNKAKELAGEGSRKDTRTFVLEKYNLDNKIQELREAREEADRQSEAEGKKPKGIENKREIAGKIKKGLEKWAKMDTRLKAFIAASLVAGSSMVSTPDDFLKGGGEGLRVSRAVSGDKDTNKGELPSVPHINLEQIESIHKISAPEPVRPVEVEVSSRGYIETIKNLQEEIVDVYGAKEKVPEKIKRTIVDVPSVELAKKFGLYSPETNESAVGIKGETLGLNSDGNVVLHKISGESRIMYDTDTNLTQQFDGKMKSDIKSGEGSNIQEQTPSTQETKQNVEQTEQAKEPATPIVEESLVLPKDVAPEDKIELGVLVDAHEFENHIPYKDSFIDTVESDKGQRVVKYNDVEIGREYDLNGVKIFKLDDKYQDGGKFLDIRSAMAEFIKVNMPKMGIGIGPVDFEGGVINIVRDPSNENMALVLLNGQVVGRGITSQQKIKFKVESKLKSGWFVADNAFERAVKKANEAIKALNKVLLIDSR